MFRPYWQSSGNCSLVEILNLKYSNRRSPIKIHTVVIFMRLISTYVPTQLLWSSIRHLQGTHPVVSPVYEFRLIPVIPGELVVFDRT
jgi:hypothetical protein